MSVEHEVELVLSDAVSLEDVAGGDHLPGEPPLGNGRVEGEDPGDLTAAAAQTAFLFGYGFSDGFYLTLVTIRPCERGRGRWVGIGE